MYFQDLLTTANIRQAYDYLTVETTRAQQCRVKYVRTVGGRNNDNAFVTFKTIHFYQHLVKGLFTLIVTTA